MKELRSTNAFGKDVKRLVKRKYSLSKLQAILDALKNNRPLPPAARPHVLQGEWAGTWECHIASDWLLMYEFTETEVRLIRTGSHSDLFE
jgi:mRNA interferase YafQ